MTLYHHQNTLLSPKTHPIANNITFVIMSLQAHIYAHSDTHTYTVTLTYTHTNTGTYKICTLKVNIYVHTHFYKERIKMCCDHGFSWIVSLQGRALS